MGEEAARAIGVADDRFEQILGARPQLLRDYQRFYALFWERRLVPLGLLELVRLNVARLLDCAGEGALRHCEGDEPLVDEADVRALSSVDYSDFAPGVSACLRYAEKFVFDVHGIDEADVASVRDHLGVEATVALTEALALFDGFMRFRNQLVSREGAPDVGGWVRVSIPRVDGSGGQRMMMEEA